MFLSHPSAAAPLESPLAATLRDGFGRRIDTLRLSVTDRCDLRCTYCMAEHPRFMPRPQLLTTDELVGIASALVDRGIRRIRLTGGEPLTRPDIATIAARLGARIGDGLDEVTMTTNATLLDRQAAALRAAGIARLNISLDTLDPALFARISRVGDVRRVLAGIAAARREGFAIRINMVAMAGINDASLVPLADWCEAQGFDLALIESMPMGAVGPDRADSHVPLHRFIAPLLGDGAAAPLPHRTSGPARYVALPGRALRLGLITPLSDNFCAQCNRVRMSADGKVHGCLGHDAAIDFAAAWRAEGPSGIAPLLDRLMATKAERHRFAIGGGLADRGPNRHMNATGG
jgi:cyclic pyranopterin phosphate synthase